MGKITELVKRAFRYLFDNNTSNIAFFPIEWRNYNSLKNNTSKLYKAQAKNTPVKNNIDINRIKAGKDARMLLMIKNIPHKMTCKELENFVNVTSFGKYNFLRLKVESKNRWNVGYAFVSLTSPNYIIDLYMHLHNYRWHISNSTKVCKLVYAIVQGAENLVEKFKNSKVMRYNYEYDSRLYRIKGIFLGLERPVF